jgi:hypothetical protein
MIYMPAIVIQGAFVGFADELSTNDFIVAAKINEQDHTSLLKKKAARFWA